jgi:hypothetical protein
MTRQANGLSDVVGWVDEDGIDLACITRQQSLQGFEIVAVEDEVAIKVRLSALCRAAFLGHNQQLAIGHPEMVRVDESLTFEVECGHGILLIGAAILTLKRRLALKWLGDFGITSSEAKVRQSYFSPASRKVGTHGGA